MNMNVDKIENTKEQKKKKGEGITEEGRGERREQRIKTSQSILSGQGEDQEFKKEIECPTRQENKTR